MNAPTISLATRFRRSAQLEHDLWAPEGLDGYVISPLAREAALRLVQEVAAEGGGRAFSIVGPYGSGKSSFLTFLLRVWRREVQALERLDRDATETAGPVREALDALGGRLVPVVVTGERGPLARAVLLALKRAVDRFWANVRRRPEFVRLLDDAIAREESGDPVSDSTIADLVATCAESMAKSAQTEVARSAGLVLVIDEMGKLLEWAAQNPQRTDLYLLQLLAERAARLRPARLAIVTVLHQELASYAEGLPRAAREEWAKIGGRFETLTYLESPRHLTSLIAGALLLDPPLRRGQARRAADGVARALAERLPASLAGAPLAACFPLHPLTALCLGPLFRRRMAQNERSLFAFLASHEPHGFQDWLKRADLSRREAGLYRLDHLYDYIVANVGSHAAADPGERTWAVAESGLARLPADAGEAHGRLVKAVALLTMLGPGLGLKPDAGALALAVELPAAQVERALADLARASLLIFRKFKDAWQLWDGSDLDVGALVDRKRLEVEARGGYADALNRLLPPEPVLATRLAHQSGTLRVLACAYASAPQLGARVDGADGLLVRLLPDRPSMLPTLVAELTVGELAPSERPVIHAVPVEPEALYAALTEFFAVTEALATTAELESDPVARRELNDRRGAALDRLTALLGPSYSQCWYFRGEELVVHGRPSRAASELLAAAYERAPVIRNELANRAQLSSAAAAARRELMERLLTRVAEPQLGIEGHPPELSIYRSVLQVTGLHRPLDPALPLGAWHLVGPTADSSLAPAWARIGEVIRHGSGRRAGFAAVCAALAEPPFGVRAGIAPILVFAWLLAHADEVFWYEQGSFLPQPGADLVHRVLRRPEDFDVQWATPSDDLGVIVRAVARHAVSGLPVDRRDAPLRLVRALVKLVAGFSAHASATQRVSPEARRVRAALKAARDPVRLLLDALPEALGLHRLGGSVIAEADAEHFAARLAEALRELAQADVRLFDALETRLAMLLGGGSTGPTFRAELAARAEVLLQSGLDLPPVTRRLADLSRPLADGAGDAEVREAA
jgi:hypothetical protein